MKTFYYLFFGIALVTTIGACGGGNSSSSVPEDISFQVNEEGYPDVQGSYLVSETNCPSSYQYDSVDVSQKGRNIEVNLNRVEKHVVPIQGGTTVMVNGEAQNYNYSGHTFVNSTTTETRTGKVMTNGAISIEVVGGSCNGYIDDDNVELVCTIYGDSCDYSLTRES
jgi:hypothetical protein